MPACRLSQEVELKQHSLALLEERARGSEAHQLGEAVAATQAELGQAQQAVQDARERKQQLVAAAKVGGWAGGLPHHYRPLGFPALPWHRQQSGQFLLSSEAGILDRGHA